MNILFLIFSISAITIAIMLFVKSREMKTGKSVFVGLRSKSDSLMRKNFHVLKGRSRFLNVKNITTFFHSVLALSIQAFIFLRNKTIQMRYTFLEKMKQRSVLKSNGSVSFYLRNVSEFKMSQRQTPGN